MGTTLPGVTWCGSEGGTRDFKLTNRKNTDLGVVFDYTSWPRGQSTSDFKGTLIVDAVHGRKWKMTLAQENGTPVRIYDGSLCADNRMAVGVLYDMPGGLPSKGEVMWWAVMESNKEGAATVGQIDINQATVSQIASCLPRPGLAWPIFEHRMFQGPFRSLEEIASIPAMDSDALIKIKERFDVR